MILAWLLLASHSGVPCEKIRGVESLPAAHSVLLIGEIHGTRESPAFAGAAVCAALEAGLSVTVALEVPAEEQGAIDEYLHSGSAGDRATMLAGPFWVAAYQDGRRSEAMVALIERLRGWIRSGYPLRALCIDEADPRRTRDTAMALRLAETALQYPHDMTIALTGNLHSRLTRESPSGSAFEPMGFLLTQMLPDWKFIALDVAFGSGTAWTCTSGDPSSCGAHRIRGIGGDGGPRLVLEHRDPSFTGVYQLPTLTASPPAVTPPADLVEKGSGPTRARAARAPFRS